MGVGSAVADMDKVTGTMALLDAATPSAGLSEAAVGVVIGLASSAGRALRAWRSRINSASSCSGDWFWM